MNDGLSLLQKTLLRSVELDGVDHVITVTNRDLFFRTEDEYKEVLDAHGKIVHYSYILEPFGRNTAPAIVTAAIHASETYDGDCTLLILPADHIISDQASFSKSVSEAIRISANDRLVLFGIESTTPETGYGYIEYNSQDVVRFVEKPNLDQAKHYLRSGRYLWNSGIFCFNADTLLKEAKQHSPDILESTRSCLERSHRSSGVGFFQIRLLPDDFQSVPNNSIDYSVLEHTKNAAVVKCDFSWSDVGCWKTLGDLTAPDSNNNRIEGNALIQDSSNCTIKGEDRVVGVVGVENLIIVDTADALLVTDKHRSQDVRHIYTKLKDIDHETHKTHRKVFRPWGSYTILETGKYFKIKRIEVKPGSSISLQMHHHRSEHWVVVQGTAKVLNNTVEFVIKENQSTYIPPTHKHRLENIDFEPLIIIEVQTGSYLGEDDIVRYQDVYGRAS
jgi:mannose-1-phosphate guanylyltransferase